MVTMVAATDPWQWQAHPEVWLLVASILALGWWAGRIIGPGWYRPGSP